jgi:hypothetical protein
MRSTSPGPQNEQADQRNRGERAAGQEGDRCAERLPECACDDAGEQCRDTGDEIEESVRGTSQILGAASAIMWASRPCVIAMCSPQSVMPLQSHVQCVL